MTRTKVMERIEVDNEVRGVVAVGCRGMRWTVSMLDSRLGLMLMILPRYSTWYRPFTLAMNFENTKD